MKNHNARRVGESAGAQTQCQAIPSNRILVVDDDRDLRLLNAEVLRRFGYQTETAEDGAAAWEALQANRYDLLITDNNMPKVSGVELVKKLRSAHMVLPVILASGAIPTEELNRNPWLRPTATMVKPFSSGQLLKTRYWRICVRSKWLIKPFSSGQLLGAVEKVLAADSPRSRAGIGFPVKTGAVLGP